MIKAYKNKILIGLALIILVSGILFIIKNSAQASTISIAGYYDSNGNLISQQFIKQAVVGGVEGVSYIKLKINAVNKDSVPLSFQILEANPTYFGSKLPLMTAKEATAGQTVSWESGLIDIRPYVGTTQTFRVKLEASSPLRQIVTKESSVDIKIDNDPMSAFDINIGSSIDNTAGINPSCTENWICSDWSICSSNTQSRTCTDQNACGTTDTKPATTNTCTAQTVYYRMNFDNKNYNSTSWIAYDSDNNGVLECYIYSTSTSTASGKRAVTITDMYSNEWSLVSGNMYLYTGGAYSYRVFKPGTGCELSVSPAISYSGKELYR